MDGLQAIFFDFDGVILDSGRIKTDAFRLMFKPYGKDIIEKVVDHHQLNGGISRVDKLDYYHRVFLNDPLDQDGLDRACARFSDLVVDQVVACPWIPGAESFLQAHYRALPLFVVSGTPETELKEIISKRGMDLYFRRIMGSPVKKPAHVKSTLQDFRLDRNRCLFVGDAMTDFHTAAETGLKFIGIQGPTPFPDGTVVLPDCRDLASAIARP